VFSVGLRLYRLKTYRMFRLKKFSIITTDKIIVADIASPQTFRNIKQNPNICIRFIDILVQKGFQVKGKAKIIRKVDSELLEMEKILNEMTGGNFPFLTITEIKIDQIKPIIAPKYILYPKTTESEQIESAKKIYRI
jgi:predicted pyridoxine 5'-phosphate oxidase superfamily flavin-nucleotide-binding protein